MVALKVSRRISFVLMIGAAAMAGDCSDDNDTGQDPATGTVAQVVVNDNDLNILESALRATNLLDSLDGPAMFTLFAPTDGAFNALGQERLDSLLSSDTAELKQILLFHFAPDTFSSQDLRGATAVSTLDGDLAIGTVGDTLILDGGVPVVQPDIRASNGIIHKIGEVLQP